MPNQETADPIADELDCFLYIVSERNDVIARFNRDFTWSVRWNEVIDQAYSPRTLTNAAVGGICRVLAAAKDNFVTAPWPELPIYNYGMSVDCDMIGPSEDIRFVIMGVFRPLALVNGDGDWSVHWRDILLLQVECEKLAFSDPLVGAVVGMFRVLLAAKDNFKTVPFSNNEE